MQEVLEILAGCPRLAVEADAIAAVLADFAGDDWPAAARAVVDWSAGPHVRRLPVNAASALRTTLHNGRYEPTRPLSRWDLEAAAEASPPPTALELCEDPEPGILALWLAVRADLRNRVPDHTFDVWFAGAHAHDLRVDELVVGAPTRCVERIQERFSHVLRNAAGAAGLTGVRIEACADHRRLEVIAS